MGIGLSEGLKHDDDCEEVSCGGRGRSIGEHFGGWSCISEIV